ncbi:MAG: radical SAM protein [Thermoplasmatota archaeon]
MKTVTIREIECKTALSTSKLPGLTYSLNPYKGCEHNCAYCYVPNVLRIDRKRWGCFVDVKKNIPSVLSKELKMKKRGVVGLSTVTDPYQPIEKKYKLTKYCLEQLNKYKFPVCIQTKSSLILRDIDLLSAFDNIEVLFSISTIKKKQQQTLEPYASSINRRLTAMKKCSQEGISTSVFFGPILPIISDHDIVESIHSFIEHGASKIWIDKLNSKPGINDNIKEKLLENSDEYNTFIKYHEKGIDYYKNKRQQIIQIGKNRNIKIIDAF